MPTFLEFTVDAVPVRMHAQEATPSHERRSRPSMLLLHGAGGDLNFWATRFGAFLTAAGISLYAPHYFDRTGTTRADLQMINDGKHVPQWIRTVEAALAFVAARPGVDPSAVVLAGVSLGGFLSTAVAARLSGGPLKTGQGSVRAVVEVSGGIVPPFDAQITPAFPPTLILHGDRDTVVPASFAHELDRLLTRNEVAHRTEILPGEGHWFSPAAMPRIAQAVSGFLQEHVLFPGGTQQRAM